MENKELLELQQEDKCVELLGEVWNEILKLKMYNEGDNSEIRFHIHCLQDKILARQGIRRMMQRLNVESSFLVVKP